MNNTELENVVGTSNPTEQDSNNVTAPSGPETNLVSQIADAFIASEHREYNRVLRIQDADGYGCWSDLKAAIKEDLDEFMVEITKRVVDELNRRDAELRSTPERVERLSTQPAFRSSQN